MAPDTKGGKETTWSSVAGMSRRGDVALFGEAPYQAAIRYDAVYDSGHIVRHCPTVDGGTRKVTSPVTWKVLKEEVNRF